MLAADSETSSLDGKETEKENNGAKMRQMRNFLDKIQQLLIMSNKIDFKIERSFENALGFNSS
jgi:mevalonate pyrophosphate decarboxylase